MVDTLEQKRVTIEDLAAIAGVAKSTVSMVFRNKKGISQETRQRVMRIAKEMKYSMFPDRQTRGHLHWGQIGFIVISKDFIRLNKEHPSPSFTYRYFNSMMHGCLEYAEKNDYSMIYSSLEWKQIKAGKLTSVLEREHVDGFLIRAWISSEVEDMIKKINAPVILLDCDRDIDGYSSVHVNNIKAMDLVVDRLVKQGCRRFATITGDLNHRNAQERLAGLQIALTRRGILLPSEGIVAESDFIDENGRRGVQKLMERGYRFDALVCQFDLMAYGAIEQLISAGIKVPDDVRVTGFDNEEFGNRISVPLTTVETNSFQIGRIGAKLLLDKKTGVNKEILNIQTDVSLVVRNSA